MMNTQNLIWTDLSDTHVVPDGVLSWLIDDDSLTAKLKQKFEDFSLHVLSQQQTYPHRNESHLLGLTGQAMIREAALLGNAQVVVFARSVIPNTQDTKDLLNIGTRPLGEVLFNHPAVKRGGLQVTHIDNVWGRRSIFTMGTTQLLVSEFFLEALYAN